MAKSQISLTTHGVETIYRNGVGKTFKNFSVTDDGNRYDINVGPDLEKKLTGGFRTLVTVASSCEMATTKPINKTKPTSEELKNETLKLEWEIGRLDCGGVSYTENNPIINVNLKTWFNYLTNTITNYNYDNRLMLTLTDNVQANQRELNSSTYLYETKNTVDDLNINYAFDTNKSMDGYVGMNAFLMSITNGVKTLINNTDTRFTSPFVFVADTDENQKGKSTNLMLSMTPKSWGYVVKLTGDKDSTFRMSDYLTITELESMSEQEINEKFRAVYPACITDGSTRNTSLFVLGDTSRTYAKGVDLLPTYTHRMFNSDGLSLMAKLIQISENYIQTNFVESTVTPGLFEQVINLKISNTNIHGDIYDDNSIDGGNIQVKLQWQSSGVDNDYDNAVIWG